MKVLIAIISCERDERNGDNQSLRDTWLPGLHDLGVDYRFFHGCDSSPGADIVVLDGPDGYCCMPPKVQGAARWAHERGYDFMFKCDRDTYVRPERLLAMPFREYDYVGSFHCPHTDWKAQHPDLALTFAFGGAGYWVSRKACGYLAIGEGGRTAYDDSWTGEVLSNHPDVRRYDERYLINDGWRATSNQTCSVPWPLKSNRVISTHLYIKNDTPYDNAAMYRTHDRWLASCEAGN